MDETIPKVEGLRLIERVDDCGRGEVWRARSTGGLAGEGEPLPGDLPGVGECRVRLLRMPVDEALRARAQTLACDLIALDEPGLLPVREVRKAYDGVALVYGHVPAAAIGLHLIARRRLLRAGEIVTLGVALSWALAHAHAAGIAHGRLTDADVLVGGDGRPVLTGVGVLGVLGAPGEPAADVRSLGRMLGSLLDRESAGAPKVVAALADSGSTAAGLAAHLAAAAPALPIVIDGAAGGQGDSAGRARAVPHLAWPRWVRPRVVVAACGVVLLGGAAGWASAPGPRAHAAPSSPIQPSPAAPQATDWRLVLSQLDTAWARGFEQPEMGFGAADVAGSPAYRADAAAAAALRAHGVHAVGLRLVLGSVAAESVSEQRVSLRVTDQRPAYELRDRSGRVTGRVAARGPATHHIVLQPSGAAGVWRIATVNS